MGTHLLLSLYFDIIVVTNRNAQFLRIEATYMYIVNKCYDQLETVKMVQIVTMTLQAHFETHLKHNIDTVVSKNCR